MSHLSRSNAGSAAASHRAKATLHHRFLIAVALGGSLAIALLALGANLALDDAVATQGDVRVADAARRALLVVDGALAERVRQAEFVAASPEVISAARAGAAKARSLGIVGSAIPGLEARFAAERSLQV